ncbi:MAG: hypothetical protein JRD89_09840 [Deltaproteobacteria bacterium]|nr:hypothetical protein [Deltaproteobacteria bacterium]
MVKTLEEAKEVYRRTLHKFLRSHGVNMSDRAAMDLQSIIFGVAGATVALLIAVIVLGNLDTATQGTVSENSTYAGLLTTVNTYGSTAITLLAIGIIVAGAAAILYIIRSSF